MDRLKKILGALCAVCITVLLLAVSLLLVNTFVGSEVNHFFADDSSLFGICRIISLFWPFLLTIIAFLLGLICGRYRLLTVFGGAAGILAITHILAPFLVQFIFTNGASNAFTKFLYAFVSVLAMPANSIAYAFNNAVNFYLTDFAGSRVFVFIATLLTFLMPVIITCGYLIGAAAQKKQSQDKETAA